MNSLIDINEFLNLINSKCFINNWSKDWSNGGCYIHLEVSEFIEALRGKGDPVEELGDVLFTLFAVADNYNISIKEAINRSILKHTNED